MLTAAGENAVHVRSCEIQAASDEAILARAVAEDRIVVSADTEFAAILANQRAGRPSFIPFRDPNLLVAADYAAMPVPALILLKPSSPAAASPFFEMADSECADFPWPD